MTPAASAPWVLALALLGCAGAPQPPAAARADDDPDLRPRMRRMQANLRSVRDAIAAGDAETAQRHASMLAHAVPPPGAGERPAAWGPEYVRHHTTFHERAAALRDALAGPDAQATLRLYVEVADACRACHEQSPTAKVVELDDLLTPPRAP